MKLELNGLYSIKVKNKNGTIDSEVTKQNTLYPLFYKKFLEGRGLSIFEASCKLLPILENESNIELLSHNNYYEKLYREETHISRLIREYEYFNNGAGTGNNASFIIDNDSNIKILGFIVFYDRPNIFNLISSLKLNEPISKNENQLLEISYSIKHTHAVELNPIDNNASYSVPLSYEYEPNKSITANVFVNYENFYFPSFSQYSVQYETNKSDYDNYSYFVSDNDARLKDNKIEIWVKIYYEVTNTNPFVVQTFNRLKLFVARDTTYKPRSCYIHSLSPDVSIQFKEEDIGKLFKIIDVSLFIEHPWLLSDFEVLKGLGL